MAAAFAAGRPAVKRLRLLRFASNRAQPLRRLLQRGLVLREAEAQDAQLRRRCVEGRHWNRGDASLAQQDVRERRVVFVRDRAVVEQLEVSPRRGAPAEARITQALEKQVAFRLVE